MEQLNASQISQVLQDVRKAYRLLALYQKRILDTINYISNNLGGNFNSGWPKFSNTDLRGSRAKIDDSPWAWLSMYLYEFNLGSIKTENGNYHLKIVHQADTGYFDKSDKKLIKLRVEQFGEVETTQTRLIFVISKDVNGCPIENHLKNHLNSKRDQTIFKDNWLSVSYDMKHFMNQKTADKVISDFKTICKDNFYDDSFTSEEFK